MKKDIQVIKADAPIQGEAEALIAKAIDNNIPVESLEKLLAMRRELHAEKAKEEYDRAMAAFQADCPTIQKTKEVHTKTGALAYRYAPIESIVDQVKQHLQKNGFSYSTNMELIENGTTKVKIAVKVTHQAGHSEITDMTVPLGTQTQIMSQTQVVAAASTFAKRYAFCNAFGILTGDEDTDAVPTDSEPKKEFKFSITPVQIENIKKLLEKKGHTEEELCIKYGVSSMIDLTLSEGTLIMNNLAALPDAQKEVVGVTQTDIESYSK